MVDETSDSRLLKLLNESESIKSVNPVLALAVLNILAYLNIEQVGSRGM